MNILTDCLPSEVFIDGKKWCIRTDFRIWLEFDRLLHLRDIAAEEKFMIIAALVFDAEKMPATRISQDSAMEALCDFYLCRKEQGSNKADKKEPCVFSFSEDADYIYAAFLSQYGIDLLSIPYMHWFVFSALLKSIDDSSRLMKIISWRSVRPEEEKNAEKRRYLERMKRLYALPDLRTEEEKEQDMAEALSEL